MSSPSSSRNPDPELNAGAPLSIEDPGDALALVQHTFGHIPEDSLVLIGLMDGATGGHLRVNLAPAQQDPVEFGQRCAAWIAGPGASPVPEAVLAVIFGSQAPDMDAPAQYDVLLTTLAEDLLLHADTRLVKVWHCGEGHIRDYECCDPLCCPYPGQEVGPALAQAVRRIPALAGTRAYSPKEAVEAFLSRSPLLTQEQIDSVRHHRAPAPQLPEAVLTLWDTALRRSIRQSSSSTRADSQWIHATPARASALLRSLQHPAHAGLLMAMTTVGLNTAVTCALAGQETAAELGHAVWGTSELPPQWERVEALDSLLHQLTPFAEGHQLEQILGLKSWIEWIRGRGSNAEAFAQKVQQLNPGRWNSRTDPPLAKTVLRWISVLGICPWAQVKRSSYSWWAGNDEIISR